jgi:hypothetical protein
LAQAEDLFHKVEIAVLDMTRQERTWHDAVKTFENCLGVFKGSEVEKTLMRSHVLHCVHNISFEDFVFLAFGPLQYGVYYMIQENDSVIATIRKPDRTDIRREMMTALRKIVEFPEFPKWKVHGTTVAVTVAFAKVVLGDDFEKKCHQPGGYLYTLYRTRMFYKKWVDACNKNVDGQLNYLFSEKTCVNFKHTDQDEWIDFMSNCFIERMNERCRIMGYLDYSASTMQSNTSPGHAQINKVDLHERAKVFVVHNAMSPEFVEEI